MQAVQFSHHFKSSLKLIDLLAILKENPNNLYRTTFSVHLNNFRIVNSSNRRSNKTTVSRTFWIIQAHDPGSFLND